MAQVIRKPRSGLFTALGELLFWTPELVEEGLGELLEAGFVLDRGAFLQIVPHTDDPRHVRVYTRDTASWVALGPVARGLLVELMRKADRAGIVDIGRAGAEGLARLLRIPLELLEPALGELLADGCVKRGERAGREALVLPNFEAAQEAAQSDAQRKRASRQKARDLLLAGAKGGPGKSRETEHRDNNPDGPECKDSEPGTSTGAVANVVPIRGAASEAVTPSHAESREVTTGHDESLLADPAELADPANLEGLASARACACAPAHASQGPGHAGPDFDSFVASGQVLATVSVAARDVTVAQQEGEMREGTGNEQAAPPQVRPWETLTEAERRRAERFRAAWNELFAVRPCYVHAWHVLGVHARDALEVADLHTLEDWRECFKKAQQLGYLRREPPRGKWRLTLSWFLGHDTEGTRNAERFFTAVMNGAWVDFGQGEQPPAQLELERPRAEPKPSSGGAGVGLVKCAAEGLAWTVNVRLSPCAGEFVGMVCARHRAELEAWHVAHPKDGPAGLRLVEWLKALATAEPPAPVAEPPPPARGATMARTAFVCCVRGKPGFGLCRGVHYRFGLCEAHTEQFDAWCEHAGSAPDKPSSAVRWIAAVQASGSSNA
jgi:hypothetical protein